MEGPPARPLASGNLALPPALPPMLVQMPGAPTPPGADGPGRFAVSTWPWSLSLGLSAWMAGGASHAELLQNSCADTARRAMPSPPTTLAWQVSRVERQP